MPRFNFVPKIAGVDPQRAQDINELQTAVETVGGDMSAHTAATDPHAQYLTQAEADALYTAGATTLDGLTDVTITTPANTQVLTYNGTQWVNAAAAGGGAAPLMEQIWSLFTDVTSPIDALITNGEWRIFAYFQEHNTAAWVSATNATYTVPAGKKLVVVQTGVSEHMSDVNYRRIQLWNTTANTFLVASNMAKINNTYAQFGPRWQGQDQAVVYGTKQAAAGDVVVMQKWNADANRRSMGMWVLCRELPA